MVIAGADEEVVPLGKIGALEEFEAKNPGPTNFTMKALELMRGRVSIIVASIRSSDIGEGWMLIDNKD